MPEPGHFLHELCEVRDRRQALEAVLPPGTFIADDLNPEQRQAFDELGPLLEREQDRLGSWWAGRGGRVLTAPLRFREPPPRPPGDAPQEARDAVGEAFVRVLRARHPGIAWTVADD